MKRKQFQGEIIVDNFAGGGGASTGILMAMGRDPDVAVNHDAEAIAMHMANHPGGTHYVRDVWEVDPLKATSGRPVGLAWFSPDCKHFSKAKGGKPVDKKIRGLAWLAVKWAKIVAPRVIVLENVEEFKEWGPLVDGRPCPKRKGATFRAFVRALQREGYQVDVRELRACDYGAPTTRKRLFLIARNDKLPIAWPKPTHGPGRLPYRTAAECIDWDLPCPSIFERKRPLAEATMRRIAKGIMRYVVNSADPFIVPVTHPRDSRVHGVDEPLRTITGAPRGEFAVVQPFVVGLAHGEHKDRPGSRVTGADEPVRTIHAGGGNYAVVTPFIARIGQTGGNGAYSNPVDAPVTTITSKAEHLLIAPYLVPRYGEREGQEPRCASVEAPLPTIVPTGNHGALVTAFLAKHNGIGAKMVVGQDLRQPTHTITSVDQKALVAANIVKLRGTSTAQPASDPLHTISAGGGKGGIHFAAVKAFLIKYYGTDQDPKLREPLHTIRTKDCFALVTVNGEEYAIADIGMRMLTPRELFRAQGFPEGYIIGDKPEQGLSLTKTAQVRMVGNSVCPPLAAAIIHANYSDLVGMEVAA